MNFDYKIENSKLHCEIKYDENDDYYTLSAIDHDKTIGYATFYIKNDDGTRKIWLQYIETDQEYAHRGIATALLQIIEYFAYKRRINFVEGKYYPKNQFAEPFYKKNDYDIIHEYYDWYISKYLSFDKIKNYGNRITVKNENEEIL